MKRVFLTLALIVLASSLYGQKKEQIAKTGYNFGPLPAVAYDADKGFQLGALLNIYNFGDGTSYPNYNSKVYLEASFFTKGSALLQLMYDNKTLIPGVRWSSAISAQLEKAMDFYGFGGYTNNLNYEAIDLGKNGDGFIYTPFYRMKRNTVLAKTDFIGHITDRFYWEAGYHAAYFGISPINRANINKGKKEGKEYPDYMTTLYEEYVNSGIISPEDADGGFVSSIRLGLLYDSRDKEGAPSKGIWAEAHLQAAPKWLGTESGFYRYSATWRHYIPIVGNDKLTFAYRLNYEGTIGDNVPFYVLPYITVMGENCDKDGMGGYRTVRGILRDRVIGKDMATYNADIRWRFISFPAFNQNISLALSLFSDGTRALRSFDITKLDQGYRNADFDQDRFHFTVGAGFRFIMNENFIVAFEYGSPVSRFLKPTDPRYMQDGTGAFYINTGYLF